MWNPCLKNNVGYFLKYSIISFSAILPVFSSAPFLSFMLFLLFVLLSVHTHPFQPFSCFLPHFIFIPFSLNSTPFMSVGCFWYFWLLSSSLIHVCIFFLLSPQLSICALLLVALHHPFFRDLHLSFLHSTTVNCKCAPIQSSSTHFLHLDVFWCAPFWPSSHCNLCSLCYYHHLTTTKAQYRVH